jgi:TPR repeat protein
VKAYYAALLALVLGVGCWKKEPELNTETVITPGEAANKLFVEAAMLISQAEPGKDSNDTAAVADYERALANIRKIVNEYPESDIAVKLVSNETLFTGKSLTQIEERVKELQRRAEEVRRAEEKRKAKVVENFKSLKGLAETGNAIAQFDLGQMYDYGRGVGKNDKEAIKWYRKAAEQKHHEAQYFLGEMYANGEGVEKDIVTGYAWVSIAANNGQPSAKIIKDTLAQKMTPAQITKAKVLSKELLKKIKAKK